MKGYYYSQNNKKFGPISLEEILANDLNENTLIWYEGLDNWVYAKDVPELKNKFGSQPPALPTAFDLPEKLPNSKNRTLLIFTSVIVLAILGIYLYQNQSQANVYIPTPSIDSVVHPSPTASKPISIDVKKIALKKFDKYSPKITKANNAVIANSEAFSGDLNNDGYDDAVIWFVMTPKEGGTMVIGYGLAVYVNSGNDMLIAAGFEPDYSFRVEDIINNKLHIVKLDFAENDGQYPTLETHKYFILNGKKLQESNTF